MATELLTGADVVTKPCCCSVSAVSGTEYAARPQPWLVVTAGPWDSTGPASQHWNVCVCTPHHTAPRHTTPPTTSTTSHHHLLLLHHNTETDASSPPSPPLPLPPPILCWGLLTQQQELMKGNYSCGDSNSSKYLSIH